jgi:diguanylate cyclase (GGDEF)-like protein
VKRRLAGAVLVLLVLAAGGVVTALTTAVVERGHRQLAEQAMTRSMGELADAVANRIENYADAVRDMAAAIGTGITDLDARTFAGLTVTMTADRLPGATTLSFVAPVPDAEVATAQAYWRARGSAGLTLYRTGSGAEHQFVIFARSYTRPPVTVGRDLSTTPATRDALNAARRTWTFAMGAAHIAVRDRQLPIEQQQVSVVMTEPVLDRVGAFRGWVVLSVRAGDFLHGTLTDRIGDTANVRLTDVDLTWSRTIVTVATGAAMNEPALNRSQHLAVGQRLWRLDMEPTGTLLSAGDRRLSRVTPLAGGAFTLLLAALVGVLANGRNRAMDRVDRATAALRLDIERRQEVEAKLRERERELHDLAFQDQLTGLANRGLYYDRVTHALATHARNRDTFAVFFIDLDGFKEVNDEHGHAAGDLVLQAAAHRLQDCVRASDTVARFGGDEFAVLVERLARPADVHVIADRMVAALRAPIQVGASEVAVTASIGIAFNRPDADADAMLRAADLAMYEAKTSGKSRHTLATS